MSEWQERITRETVPAIRVEHELRYRLAAPLIIAGETWSDLGCGNGLAAAAALGGARPPRTVLVDLDEDAVRRAAGTLALDGATVIAGDLTDGEVLKRTEDALLAGEGDRVVTCFEVVEHLRSFTPLIVWCARLAREHGVTCILSVPNDAFWAVQNPHHMTKWSEGAFEELRRLLPSEECTLLRQVALSGSAVVAWDGSPARHETEIKAGGQGSVATHFIAAFGPRHAEIEPAALVAQTDTLAQRRWERERESNLMLAEQSVVEQRERLQADAQTFEEWRAYIHELERRLGDPLSGITKPREDSPS